MLLLNCTYKKTRGELCLKIKLCFGIPHVAKRRIPVLFLCLALFLVCLNSCKLNESGISGISNIAGTSVSTGQSATGTTDSKESTTGYQDTSTDYDETTTAPNNKTTGTNEKTTTAKKKTTTIQKTTTTKGSTTTTKASADSIELVILNYFPELPGYSTEYEIGMICDGVQRKVGEYTLKVTPNDLVVRENVVIASDQQKKTYDKFTVEATDKLTGKKAQMTITPRKWKLNFKDDFDGDSLNTNIWTRYEYPYTNYYVRDGALTLLAEHKDEIYTMSGIRTLKEYSLKGGCFMARMKSPDKGGCNSAFWLMPEGRYKRDFFFMDTKLKNYGCSEIDIVEYSPFYGKEFPLTMHFWNSSGAHTAKSYWGSCDDNIYEDYHEYACIWEQDGIYFYFDGKPVFANRDVDTHSRAVAAYIVLSVNSAKIHEGLEWLGPCTDDMFPFKTKFDWVKTYY